MERSRAAAHAPDDTPSEAGVSPPTEMEVRQRVHEYLQDALLTGDRRKMSVRHIAKNVARCSHTRIYQHRLNADIHSTKRRLNSRVGERDGVRLSAAKRRAAALEADRDLWKRRHGALLTRLLIIESHIRGHPTIDLDALYTAGLRKPPRSEPAKRAPRPGNRR